MKRGKKKMVMYLYIKKNDGKIKERKNKRGIKKGNVVLPT
jgi:hypothetical protein